MAVLAYKIRRRDDRLFWQVGELVDGKVEPGCKLPGSKCNRGELPGETAQRVLTTKLLPLASLIEVETFHREVVNKPSKEFALPTKYLRTEVEASFVGELDEAEYGLANHFEFPDLEDDEDVVHKRFSSDDSRINWAAAKMPPLVRHAKTMDLDAGPISQIQNHGFVFNVNGKTAIYAWLDTAEWHAVTESERVSRWLAAFTPKGLLLNDVFV